MDIDLNEFSIDASKDYRERLLNFKVDKKGNLWVNRWGNQTHNTENWELLILKSELKEDDWISHMVGKGYCDFGEFIKAYFKALEKYGVKSITITLRNFDFGFKFADE